MNNIYLTSAISFVAGGISQKLNAKKRKLKLLFVDTAAEVEKGNMQWLIDDRKSLVEGGFKVIDFSVTNKSKKEIVEVFEKVDVIYLSGGNTYYLLYQLRKTGAFGLIKEFVNKKGKIYIGTSAGSIVVGSDIKPFYSLDSKEWAKKLSSTNGLRLVDFVILPHWGQDFFKDRYLNSQMKHVYNTDNKLILLNDYCYVEVLGGSYKIVDVREEG